MPRIKKSDPVQPSIVPQIQAAREIGDYLTHEYLAFAKYVVNHRAIPSVIDGLKPTQRKILHGATLVCKSPSEKPIRVFQLAGRVSADCFYHHGNVSMENAIIEMARSFKNNMPLLEEHGIFGSLRTPEASAARYISTKLSQNFYLLYKDLELMEYREEEGISIEPYVFFPIVPTVLINGSSGIAVGVSTNILNRSPLDVVLACESVLKNKPFDEPVPHNPYFTGTWTRDAQKHKKWHIRGLFTRNSDTSLTITELPLSYTFEKFETHLNKLVDEKKITSYIDKSSEKVEYNIKGQFAGVSDDKLIKMLDLEETITENFTVLDENNQVVEFDSASDIILYFVNYRLGIYGKRKEYLISKYSKEIAELENKAKFVTLVVSNKLKISNRPKIDIVADMKKHDLLPDGDGTYDHLLRMSISSLTKEMVDKLLLEHEKKKQELDAIRKKEPKDMYLSELTELKKKLK